MLRVIDGGALATIQDLGRAGWQRFGVPQSGAMDFAACEIANRLVANSPNAATIEITAGGAVFEVLAPIVVAVTGADLGAIVNHQPLPLWTSLFARAGAQIAFEGRRGDWGARAYLAVAGGFDAPVVLGSRSTYLPGSFGGWHGRALQGGDVLPIVHCQSQLTDFARLAGRTWPATARPAYRVEPVFRVLPGPHLDCFDSNALEALTQATWTVQPTSNRIGLRLDGARLRYARPCELPSLGVFPGVIQVPPDGAPIVLMADAQTTGGYPIIAVTIQADLPLAAQLLPRDTLRFALTTHQAAVQAWRELRAKCEVWLGEDDGVTLAANARG